MPVSKIGVGRSAEALITVTEEERSIVPNGL
jgi:hypothetical protein